MQNQLNQMSPRDWLGFSFGFCIYAKPAVLRAVLALHSETTCGRLWGPFVVLGSKASKCSLGWTIITALEPSFTGSGQMPLLPTDLDFPFLRLLECPWFARLMHPSTKLVHPVGTHAPHSLPMETSTPPSKGIGEAGPARPPPASRIEFRSGSSECRISGLSRQRPCPKTSACDASSSWKI